MNLRIMPCVALLLLAMACQTHAGPAEDYRWLQNYTHSILTACRRNASDGTTIYGPNGCAGHGSCYAGVWMRDSYYGFSSGWQQIANASEALGSAAYILRRSQASTNYLPQSVDPSGHAAYGQHHAPTTLDAGAFAGLMFAFFVTGEGSKAPGGGLAFLKKFGSAVALAMESTPTRRGLPWSDPALPCVGFGFTDTIIKTGNELYSSILLWDASRRLAAAFDIAGNASMSGRFHLKASHIEANFSSTFWSEEHGMFMATNGLESDRIDVWGSAYAALVGLALPEQARRVANFLATNKSQVFFAGQTRMLPAPQVWSGEFPREPGPGRYQDGGYWGSECYGVPSRASCCSLLKAACPNLVLAAPSHHTLVLLGRHGYRKLACELLGEAVGNYRSHGAYEWIQLGAESGSGAPLYVATAANTLKAAEELACWAE